MTCSSATELLTRMAVPFFQAGEPHLFVVLCCNRVYVAPSEAQKCRTCLNAPTNHRIRSLKDIEEPSDALSALMQDIEAQSVFDPAK